MARIDIKDEAMREVEKGGIRIRGVYLVCVFIVYLLRKLRVILQW